MRPVRLARPLDFAAVTDHGEYLGEVLTCTESGSGGYESDLCNEFGKGGANAVVRLGEELLMMTPLRPPEVCGENCSTPARSVWKRIQEATEEACDRSSACSFTAFHAYEWSANTEGRNLHRNIVFRDRRVPHLPISYFDAPTPEELWQSLERTCSDIGCKVLAIPHNANLSNGGMFAPFYLGATALGHKQHPV